MPLKSRKRWTVRRFGWATPIITLTSPRPTAAAPSSTPARVVTITFASNADKTYAIDPTGIANNEDSHHARQCRQDAERPCPRQYSADESESGRRAVSDAGSNGDTTLEGAVYDLVMPLTRLNTRTVFRVSWINSKITDANGTPFGTPLSSPMAAGIPITCPFAERPAGSLRQNHRRKAGFCQPVHGPLLSGRACHRCVLPIDGNGKLYVTGYPQLREAGTHRQVQQPIHQGRRVHRLHLQKTSIPP